MDQEYSENPLTNNQNELENICAAQAGLSQEDFERGIRTATEQIFKQRGQTADVFKTIGRAFDSVTSKKQNALGIYLSVNHALDQLQMHFSESELMKHIDQLEENGQISLEFHGFVTGTIVARRKS